MMMMHSLGDGMVNKFTDEQLSRILTAHELGQLELTGYACNSYPCCINQAAFLTFWCADSKYDCEETAYWFDNNYNKTWTTEEFIEKLTEQQFI